MASLLRHTGRLLLRNPGPTLGALASLAFGIGASTAIFSLADALFLRPLAVSAPDRLVSVNTRSATGETEGLSFPEFEETRQSIPALEALALVDRRGATYRQGDELEMLRLDAVSDGYFDLLGVRPALGRIFQAPADRELPAPPVIISDRLWRHRFGADPTLIDRPVRLSDRLYTVIGILPPSFRGLDRGTVTDVWIDLDTWSHFYGNPATFASRGARAFEVIGRLRPSSTLAEANAQLAGLGHRWASDHPDASGGRGLLATGADEVSGRAGLNLTLLLVSIVTLVVVIACLNVATLRLAQGDRRRREFAVRLAIGAGPGRLIRQLLGEGLVLVGIGSVGGLLIAQWLVSAAPALLPPSPFALDYDIRLDARVLGFALGMALLATLLSGLPPALRAARTAVMQSLRPGENPGNGRLPSLNTMLVALQVALAVVLLNGAGLLLKSFLATRDLWPGFAATKDLLVVELSMGDEDGTQKEWAARLDAMRERIGALPGVAHATYVRRIPMAGYGDGATLAVSVPGRPSGIGSKPREVRYNQPGPGYLDTMATRLLRGRFFAPEEHVPTARVVVISADFARKYFPDEKPIGQFLRIESEAFQIIGVVEDARISRIHEEREPFFYVPYATRPSSDVAIVAETLVPPGTEAAAIKQAIRSVRAGTWILGTTTMRDHMAAKLHADWMPAVLGSALSMLGVGLALIGLYGAVALLTLRRTRELAIRLALGALPRALLLSVLGQAIVIASAGGVAGLLAAVATARLLESFLYGVGPLDPAVLGGSAAAAVVIGILAGLAPASRTLRIDPARTLKYE
jgi:putative ABC transport system permease protein